MLHAFAIEQAWAVNQIAAIAIPLRPYLELDVQLRGDRRDTLWKEGQIPAQACLSAGLVLQDEPGLMNRVHGGIARRVQGGDHAVEGRILVAEGLQHMGADTSQERPPGRVPA